MKKRPRAALLYPLTLAITAALLPSQVQAGSPTTTTTTVPDTTTTVADTPTTAATTTTTTSTTVATDVPTTTVADAVPPTSGTVAPGSIPVQGEAIVAPATSVAPSTAPEVMAAAAEPTGSIGGTVFQDYNNDAVFDQTDGGFNAEVDVVCGDVTATERTDPDGNYRVDNLPLGDCTVTVDRAGSFYVFESLVKQTFDPDGGLDGTSKVTLTAEAPTQLDQNFGYRVEPTVFATMEVREVEDTVADQQVSVGDTILYQVTVQELGVKEAITDLTVTDTKLGLPDSQGPGGGIVIDPLYDEYYLYVSYVITAEDVAAGGVETSATVRAVNPDTGEVLTIRSDTATDPSGNEIKNPRTVETDNPLKVNSNDTTDPTDDPTTYLIPKVTTPTVAPPTTVAKRSSTLPATGFSIVMFGLVAALLVATGIGLRLTAARSSRRSA